MSNSSGAMTAQEEALAARIYEAVQHFTNNSPRSQQAAGFHVGVSDIGTCPERTRRLLAGIPMVEQPDKLEAFIGTAIGNDVEAAVQAMYPDAIVQAEVNTIIEAGAQRWQVTGHPDLLIPVGCADPAGVQLAPEGFALIIDGKTVDGLDVTRRTGPSQQQLFQRHIYAKGALEAGLLGTDDPNKVLTANVWMDRSGTAKQLHVHGDSYSPDIIAAAGLWLEDVYYAYDHGQVAEKAPPREWCRRACGHFSDCRMYDSDVEGLITDERLQTAIQVHLEGNALSKQGEEMKKRANNMLKGVSGYTPDGAQIRWIHVNASAPGTTNGRAAYERLQITPAGG